MLRDPRFQTLPYAQISSSDGRDLRLKEFPAIYAWYRNLDLRNVCNSASNFIQKIESLLKEKLSERFEGRLGLLYEVIIQESGGPLPDSKKELLETLAQDEHLRGRLASILETMTFMQAPLYVGQTIDLRRRIEDHLAFSSDLYVRLLSAGIEIESCILGYKYIDKKDLNEMAAYVSKGKDPTIEDMKVIAFLLEDLFTRLSPSAFVRRSG